jgi:prepilin-type N-terminal cleavage/methylation domain-containing protein
MRRPARAFTLLEMLIVLGVILILTTLVLGVSSAVLKGAESAQMRAAFNTMESAFAEWESVTGRPVSYCGTGVGEPSGGSPAAFDLWEPTGAPPGATTPSATTYGVARGVGVYAVNLLMQVESVKGILAGIPPNLLRAEASNNLATMYPPANVALGSGAPAQTYLPSAAQLLGSVSGNNPRPLTSRAEFVDPWGNRVAFVFPGREWRVTDPGIPDGDGTVRTALENLDIGFGVCAASRICLVSAGPDGVFGADGDAPTSLGAADRLTFRRTAAADNVYLYDLDPPDN